MRDSLNSYMKVGIVHFMAFPSAVTGEGPLLDTVSRIITDEFFNAIEVTRIRDPEVRRNVAAALNVSGLLVGYGAQPQLLNNNCDLNSLDGIRRLAAVQEVKSCIDEAIEIGADRLALLSGKDPGEHDRAAAMKALNASLEEICDYAESKSELGITLEVFDRSVDKKCLIGSTEEAVAIACGLRRQFPGFGLMVDLSHLPLQGETAQESLGIARDYLAHIHIGNCILDKSHPAFGDSHPRFGHPNGENGVAELREFLRVLLDVGYVAPGKQNVVAFEVKPLPGETPEMVISNAKRTLIEAWATL